MTSTSTLAQAVCGLDIKGCGHNCANTYVDVNGDVQPCYHNLWGDNIQASIKALKEHLLRFTSANFGCKQRGMEVYNALQLTATQGGMGFVNATCVAPSVEYMVCACPTTCPARAMPCTDSARAVCAQIGTRRVCRHVFLLHYPVASSTLGRMVAKKRANFGACAHIELSNTCACHVCEHACMRHALNYNHESHACRVDNGRRCQHVPTCVRRCASR